MDYDRAPLDEADRSMLDYALKVTRDPATVARQDVEALRSVGFGDRAILDICQIACYYAYVNRLADGLGVDLEDWWTADELTVTREEWTAARKARSR